MTRDRKRKQAVRSAAATNGESYVRAARRMNRDGSPTPILTTAVVDDLVAAFRTAGWPVEVEPNLMEGGTRWLFAGPTHATVTRESNSFGQDFDPDDADQADLDVPPAVHFGAPSLGDPCISVTASGEEPCARVVERLDRALAQERSRALKEAIDDTRCAVCGDRYPLRHLLAPTDSEELLVCPACVFDGDLLSADTIALAHDLDRLVGGDLAAPAGWTAVVALLACAGGPGSTTLLDREWRASGSLYAPAEHWGDPRRLWVWLPPRADRPAALSHLGCGASLGAVLDAVERAHPDLRDRVRDRLRDDLELDEEDADYTHDYLVEQVWPAVIAYAVTFGTQTGERGAHRPPWHVLDSLEEGCLADHFEQAGSNLAPVADLGTIFTLHTGIPVVAETLGWDTGY